MGLGGRRYAFLALPPGTKSRSSNQQVGSLSAPPLEPHLSPTLLPFILKPFVCPAQPHLASPLDPFEPHRFKWPMPPCIQDKEEETRVTFGGLQYLKDLFSKGKEGRWSEEVFQV